MDFQARPMRNTFTGLPALAAALMLLTATSHAASNSVVPCQQVGRNLQSLAVPVDQLTVNPVDHAAIDAEIVDEEPAVGESVAPVLNLGTRVTSILRDVFDTMTEELPQDSTEQATTSPLADSDGKKDQAELDDANGDKAALPRFQRQMLRTDI